MFKEIFETPLRQGTRNPGDFSGELDFKSYINSSLLLLIDDKFTAKRYKIYKTPSKYFVTDKNDIYKLYIEYTLIPNGIQIDIAHSDEPRLFGKFMEYLVTKFTYVVSGDRQSKQAEKSWKRLLKNYKDIYINIGNEYEKINHKDIEMYYNTTARIAIKESEQGYTKNLIDFLEKEKISTFRQLIENSPEQADCYLFESCRDY